MQTAIDKALQVKNLYSQLQSRQGKNKWDYREHVEGFVGDVGDLMKLIMAKSNLREYRGEDLDKDIEHELSDCLWCVFVIADDLEIDIEKVFNKNMDELFQRVKNNLVENN